MLPTRGSPFEVDHGEGKLRGYVVWSSKRRSRRTADDL